MPLTRSWRLRSAFHQRQHHTGMRAYLGRSRSGHQTSLPASCGRTLVLVPARSSLRLTSICRHQRRRRVLFHRRAIVAALLRQSTFSAHLQPCAVSFSAQHTALVVCARTKSRLMDESQRAQLSNLPFINGRLKTKIELIEVLQERQVCELKSGAQITATPCFHFAAE